MSDPELFSDVDANKLIHEHVMDLCWHEYGFMDYRFYRKCQKCGHGLEPKEDPANPNPDYRNDLNAAMRAQMRWCEDHVVGFVNYIWKEFRYLQHPSGHWAVYLLTLTARDRVDAILACLPDAT